MKALKIRLAAWQRRRLERLRDSAGSMRVGRRVICLLLSAEGLPVQRISEITGLSRKAVTNIRSRWQERGMRSLADRSRPGRPPRVTADYRRELKRALLRGPLAYGYVQTLWSVARLGTHLQNRTGIRLCPDWLRRLMHREGFSCGRPAHTLAGKRRRRDYRDARKRLNRLKKGLSCLRPTLNSGTKMKARFICIRTWRAAG